MVRDKKKITLILLIVKLKNWSIIIRVSAYFPTCAIPPAPCLLYMHSTWYVQILYLCIAIPSHTWYHSRDQVLWCDRHRFLCLFLKIFTNMDLFIERLDYAYIFYVLVGSYKIYTQFVPWKFIHFLGSLISVCFSDHISP